MKNTNDDSLSNNEDDLDLINIDNFFSTDVYVDNVADDEFEEFSFSDDELMEEMERYVDKAPAFEKPKLSQNVEQKNSFTPDKKDEDWSFDKRQSVKNDFDSSKKTSTTNNYDSYFEGIEEIDLMDELLSFESDEYDFVWDQKESPVKLSEKNLNASSPDVELPIIEPFKEQETDNEGNALAVVNQLEQETDNDFFADIVEVQNLDNDDWGFADEIDSTDVETFSYNDDESDDGWGFEDVEEGSDESDNKGFVTDPEIVDEINFSDDESIDPNVLSSFSKKKDRKNSFAKPSETQLDAAITDENDSSSIDSGKETKTSLFAKISAVFNNILAQVLADAKGEKISDWKQDDDEQDGNIRQENEQKPVKQPKANKGHKSLASNKLVKLLLFPFRQINALYAKIIDLIFIVIVGVLKIFAGLPLIGGLIKSLASLLDTVVKPVLKNITYFILLIIIVAPWYSYPKVEIGNLLDDANVEITNYSLHKDTKTLTAEITNIGDVYAEIEPTFELYAIKPTINPVTWVTFSKVGSCTIPEQYLEIDIDTKVTAQANCDNVQGFWVTLGGKIN